MRLASQKSQVVSCSQLLPGGGPNFPVSRASRRRMAFDWACDLPSTTSTGTSPNWLTRRNSSGRSGRGSSRSTQT